MAQGLISWALGAHSRTLDPSVVVEVAALAVVVGNATFFVIRATFSLARVTVGMANR